MKPFFVFKCFLTVLLLSSCKTKSLLPDPLSAGWNGKKVCEKDVSGEDPQKFINFANLSDLESGFTK